MTLNEVQKSIVTGILEGKTNTEIAEEIGYSTDSVKKNLKKLEKHITQNLILKIYKHFGIKADASVKRAMLVKEITREEMSRLMQ